MGLASSSSCWWICSKHREHEQGEQSHDTTITDSIHKTPRSDRVKCTFFRPIQASSSSQIHPSAIGSFAPCCRPSNSTAPSTLKSVAVFLVQDSLLTSCVLVSQQLALNICGSRLQRAGNLEA
ncbi:uncharacterized protein UDID_17287 [Ustilago sp. UG-2017a]|nr:uncharacterized protein UDID_17287 [Ustilago sp. UG-2017a]